MSKFDDERLLKSLRRGCSDASGELVRNHYERVYRFLVHLTRDAHWAEDLTQETFSAAWEGIGSFQGRSSLATWLHRIAYTKFIDAQRSNLRAAKLRESFSRSEILVVDPFRFVMAEDDNRQLYQALGELDAANRTLLVLHYLQGLSYREIALVLDEPSGTIKWRMTAALKCLRHLLEKEVPDHATPRTI